ncbi:eCIS core domain-containing protein [Geomonas azotofigens]|uniref:eCIS core domain-containing protein n=1 Tax=Geomonas azotofigens TaxID=2843196 RepID=UPI001C126359|nr:DUF4157 domain-containing protein [Geomonas azotofigens]MBU5612521.1 DUF4157 domain-containing protein [Geomonas azotofigens]
MKSCAEKSSSSSTAAAQVSRQPFVAPTVQRKLTVSKPGDKMEQEADRSADQVMRMAQPTGAGAERLDRQQERLDRQREQLPRQQEESPRQANEEQLRRQRDEKVERQEERLQREASADERLGRQAKAAAEGAPEEKIARADSGPAPTVSDAVQSAVKEGASGGQPLPGEVRSFMEPRFGSDFSSVRVHNDDRAAGLSEDLSARAFTYGNHVFFARDAYHPGTSEGKRLIAHELAHTEQQGAGLARQGNPHREGRDEQAAAVMRAAAPAAPKAATPAAEGPASSELVDVSSAVFAPSEKVKEEIEASKGNGLEVRIIVKGLTGEGRVKVRMDSKKNLDSIGKGTMPLQNPWTDQLGGMHVNFTIRNNEIKDGYASLKPKGGDTNEWLRALQKNSELLGGLGLKVERLPRPINRFESGKLTLGVEGVKVEIGGFLDANLNLSVENVAKPKIDASATVDVKGMVKGELKLDNSTGPLAGQLTLAVNHKSFSGQGTVIYKPDGTVDIGGKAGYNADKLSGEVAFVATDMESANKFAKDAIAAAGGKENIVATGPPPPVPAPKPNAKTRAIAATGQLQFHLTQWFAGTVWVVVDGRGLLTVVSKIAPPGEIPLFPQKNFDREIVKFEAKAYYGIPVVGDLNLFANISLWALARLGPAKIYNIEILGTYSTDPEVQKFIQISASFNISAYAGLRLRAEGGAGIEIASHDLKFGIGIQVDVGLQAYADARPTIGYRDPGVFYVGGTLDIVAQPMLDLGGDFFIALEAPWWSPISDHRWTWPLFSKQWPLADPVGISAVVKEYVLGSGQVPEIELKKPEFDPSKFMTSMVDDKLPEKSGGKGSGSGSFKDDGSIPPPTIPPKKPAPKKPEPKPTKKGAPPPGGTKSAKPDPKSAKEKDIAKTFQAAAKPLGTLRAGGPFTRAMLDAELGKIKASVKGVSFDIQAKGDNWIVTPKAGGKSAKPVQLKGKNIDKDAKDGKKDVRTEAQKQADLEAALSEANKLLEDENKDAPEITSALVAIKAKYKLTALELVEAPADEDEVYDSIQASVNPKKGTPKRKRLRKHKSALVTRKGHKYVLIDGYDTKEVIRDSFYGKSYRKDVYEWRDERVNNPAKLRHPTNPKLYWWKNRYWDKTKAYDEAPTVDHKKQAVVDHWNSDGRDTHQDARKDYFNDIKGLEVVPYSENSSMGAKLAGSYKKTVTINFRGPGEGRK